MIWDRIIYKLPRSYNEMVTSCLAIPYLFLRQRMMCSHIPSFSSVYTFRKFRTLFRIILFWNPTFTQLLRKIHFDSPKLWDPRNLLFIPLLYENESIGQLNGALFFSFHGFHPNSHFLICRLLGKKLCRKSWMSHCHLQKVSLLNWLSFFFVVLY